MGERQMSDEGLRADADIAREQALEMERRKARGRRRLLEPRLVEIMLAQNSGWRGPSAAIRPCLPAGASERFCSCGQHRPAGAAFATRFLRLQHGFRARQRAERRACASEVASAGARNAPMRTALPWLHSINWLRLVQFHAHPIGIENDVLRGGGPAGDRREWRASASHALRALRCHERDETPRRAAPRPLPGTAESAMPRAG